LDSFLTGSTPASNEILHKKISKHVRDLRQLEQKVDMRKTLLILFLLLVFGCLEAQPKLESARVSRVIDGDTLVLEDNQTVRLIGINTPEKGQPGYSAAKQELGFLTGERVFLERDVADKDRYGRLLRYVYHNGLVNALLVRKGLAPVYRTNNKKHLGELLEAEDISRKAGRGIWSKSNISCLRAYIHCDAKGKDEKNLNDEYVVFESQCDRAVNMTHWLLKDESTNSFTFPAEMLFPGGAITVRTGRGLANTTDIYWNRSTPVWNNNYDRLYLFDEEGKLVVFKEY